MSLNMFTTFWFWSQVLWVTIWSDLELQPLWMGRSTKVKGWGHETREGCILVSLVLWFQTCNYTVTSNSYSYTHLQSKSPGTFSEAIHTMHCDCQLMARYATLYVPWGSSPAFCQWLCDWGCYEQLTGWPSWTAPSYPWITESPKSHIRQECKISKEQTAVHTSSSCTIGFVTVFVLDQTEQDLDPPI